MNQPTRGEFDELKEEVRKLREQQTEPIQITVERKYPERDLLQNLSRKQDEQDRLLLAHSRGISTLQNEMQGARADIISIKATLSDHGEFLRAYSKRFDKLEATQDEHSKRFDKLETIMMQILDRLP